MEYRSTIGTPDGCVHGRFQPFHIEHLEYVLAAIKQCKHLAIGLVKGPPPSYQTKNIQQYSPLHRHEKFSNPLSFDERARLITAALVHNNIAPNRFSFINFPIDEPTLIVDYLPKTTICYTTRCDIWSDEKIKRLEENGFIVKILFDRDENRLHARNIRELVINGDLTWKNLVPDPIAPMLVEYKFKERLRKLAKNTY